MERAALDQSHAQRSEHGEDPPIFPNARLGQALQHERGRGGTSGSNTQLLFQPHVSTLRAFIYAATTEANPRSQSPIISIASFHNCGTIHRRTIC
jgi:hypothetical protein